MKQRVFAGVDPSRLGEVRRRVTLVKAYLRSSMSAADREHAAGQLGITAGQFGRLVRAWREQGAAKDLHGAGRTRGKERASTRLSPATRAVLEKAILDAEPEIRGATLLEIIRKRCAALGTAPPAPSTVTQHLKRAREGGLAAGVGQRRIAIAQCDFRFPVDRHGSVARPWALLAVAIPEGTIIAVITGVTDIADGHIAMLVAKIAGLSTANAPRTPIVASPALAASASRFGNIRVRSSTTARLSVSRILGGRIGGLQIAFGARSDRDLRATTRCRLNKAVDVDDATALVMMAVSEHNATRQVAKPFAVERLDDSN